MTTQDSNPEVALPAWSRPRLQRTELGPMLHHFGHLVYDNLETAIGDGLTDKCEYPNDLLELQEIVRALGSHSMVVTEGLIKQEPHTAIRDFTQYVVQASKQGVRRVVTINIEDSIQEGVVGGVSVPFQLYRSILTDRAEKSIDVSRMMTAGARSIAVSRVVAASVDAGEILGYFSDSRFLGMLEDLANAPNGFLGPASAGALLTGAELRCFRDPTRLATEEIFATNSEGRIVGFSDEFNNFRMERLRIYNSIWRESNHESSGCPIRHHSFPVVGEHAQAYIDALTQQLGTLPERNETLVARGCRLAHMAVARVCEMGAPHKQQ